MTFASGKVSLKLCWLKAFISMHTYTYWVCYFIANARCSYVCVCLYTIANQVAVHKLNWLHCKSLYDVAYKSQKTTAIFSIFHVFPCLGSSFFSTWLYKWVLVYASMKIQKVFYCCFCFHFISFAIIIAKSWVCI